jgi:hypothetical protein
MDHRILRRNNECIFRGISILPGLVGNQGEKGCRSELNSAAKILSLKKDLQEGPLRISLKKKLKWRGEEG